MFSKDYDGKHLERAEEELKVLEEERKTAQEDEKEKVDTETGEVVEEKVVELSPEEANWKKRHGDLRRHAQQKDEAHAKELLALKEQLESATKQAIQLPKTDDELEAWTKEFPDVAAMVETIAIKKSQDRDADFKKQQEALEVIKQQIEVSKAEAELRKFHPDFEDLKNDEKFHEWANEQPEAIRNLLYNSNDAPACARAIDLYKLTIKKPTKAETKKAEKEAEKEAAKAIPTNKKGEKPSESKEKTFTETQIQAMRPEEFEKLADEISLAQREGRVILDISGGAR